MRQAKLTGKWHESMNKYWNCSQLMSEAFLCSFEPVAASYKLIVPLDQQCRLSGNLQVLSLVCSLNESLNKALRLGHAFELHPGWMKAGAELSPTWLLKQTKGPANEKPWEANMRQIMCSCPHEMTCWKWVHWHQLCIQFSSCSHLSSRPSAFATLGSLIHVGYQLFTCF